MKYLKDEQGPTNDLQRFNVHRY